MSIQSQRLWAMEPQRLAGLFREMKARGLPDAAAVAAMAAATGGREEPLYQRVGPLAVIEMHGALAKEGSYWWGIASMRQIGAALLQAARDPGVKGILLDIDSPGGTVAGTEELAGIARAVAAAKPLYAYAGDLMCSAAYWIGSQAREICSQASAQIGSIGVVMTHTDWSGWDAQAGLDVTYLTAGHYKAIANPDEPLSDEARAYLQQQLDATYTLFLEAVAAGRRVSAEQALAMADGKVFLGRQALELGLVDRLESRAEYINRIVQEVHMDLAKLKAEHPGVVQEVRAEIETELAASHKAAITAAVEGERSRVLGVVGVLVGEEQGGRIAAVVGSGVTAEQAKALGAALGGGGQAGPAQADQPGAGSPSTKEALGLLAKATADPLNQSGDPRAAAPDFDALVKAEMDKGLSKAKAIAVVAKANPEAHKAWIAKHNKEGE
ncbi:MAG TPA: signal peptide peptidase SppA [Solidesulfovibrio magneticus]|nr:signal peptide peptidase SppA [Solidesulfovibrio magneticus]